MGQAKRRGTFNQRKAQRLANQYGLTNREIANAYLLNKQYNMRSFYSSKSYQIMNQLMYLLRT